MRCAWTKPCAPGETLVLYGMLLYGIPGTEEAGELTALVLTLMVDSNAPLGFRFVSVELA